MEKDHSALDPFSRETFLYSFNVIVKQFVKGAQESPTVAMATVRHYAKRPSKSQLLENTLITNSVTKFSYLTRGMRKNYRVEHALFMETL